MWTLFLQAGFNFIWVLNTNPAEATKIMQSLCYICNFNYIFGSEFFSCMEILFPPAIKMTVSRVFPFCLHVNICWHFKTYNSATYFLCFYRRLETRKISITILCCCLLYHLCANPIKIVNVSLSFKHSIPMFFGTIFHRNVQFLYSEFLKVLDATFYKLYKKC